ncbi:3'(2'),5'-bisphosphate nucleotidase CysQ [Methylobacterium sp. J-078]|uniref:3'(2'),5'-bisphosphate nucleotidase CysQ family protein n=1 Tax=Methylobacterium sp. J-078 TaxID=2836657 RepID=UPI001FB9A18A|nr:3'(2'),5'-bisphosphate nucleotidase CysQ [Methylobacterium sp. J-078]MCJ2045108.1 3'(2'),5'-bisphosphate nucleotidase CysQ [Methylobacterium sp. J-078]
MSIDAPTRDRIATALMEIACRAGEILKRHHGGDCPHVIKPDGSPASQADAESEAFILAELDRRWPEIPVIAEESSYDHPPAPLFFLVDPLDGTRDFLAGNPEYSVNIGLIAGDRPVAAALAAPGLGRVWGAGARAFEATVSDGRPGALAPIAVRPRPDAGLVALTSNRHCDHETELCLEALKIGATRSAASALKFCLIAAGEADIYVRCGPTMEWDTAAGDHILTVAGGCVVAPAGRPMTYGHYTRHYRNGPFAALGHAGYADDLVLPERSPAARGARHTARSESPARA